MRPLSIQDPVVTLQSARSFLFVPGDRPERFSKAVASGTDVVIVDLEDAVSTQNKDSALQAVTAWLSGTGHAVVRIGRDKDVEALIGLPGLLGVMVPKAEIPGGLLRISEAVERPVIALI